MKRSLLLLVPAALAACQDAPHPAAAPAPSAPLFAAAGAAVEGRYIIVLKEGSKPRSVAAISKVAPDYVYEHALTGFAARLNQGQLTALQHNPNVAYIEQDQMMTAVATQNSAPWGLDRSDQRALPLSTTFTYGATGAGVNAYVVDTGIRFDHTDFGGRAVSGYDAVDGGSADDCNGHGTHVAGSVGGTTYGIAKGVRLIGVRVLDCQGSGTNSGVIAGIDWVTANHVKPAVANMSLGGGASTALDDAVRRSIAAGVAYSVAAGNGNWLGFAQDACKTSPARVTEALTIGATDKTDTKASWSNYGTCLDLFAPGVGITSAWHTGASATNTISGTSMAAPHVAGVAALYLQGTPGASPSQVASALVGNATTGVVKSAGRGSPNRLLFTSY